MLATDFWLDVAPIIVLTIGGLLILGCLLAILFGTLVLVTWLRDERAARDEVRAADDAAREETLVAVLTGLPSPMDRPACVTPIHAAPSFRRTRRPRGAA